MGPLEEEIPNLETIIFRFHVKFLGCNGVTHTNVACRMVELLLLEGAKQDQKDGWMVVANFTSGRAGMGVVLLMEEIWLTTWDGAETL